MYNSKRAASVKCARPGVLFTLDRLTFTHIVQESAIQLRKEYQRIIDQIEILSGLEQAERELLCDSLREERFGRDEYVVREGEPGDRLYFVMEAQDQSSGGGLQVRGEGVLWVDLAGQEHGAAGERADTWQVPAAVGRT